MRQTAQNWITTIRGVAIIVSKLHAANEKAAIRAAHAQYTELTA